MDYLFSFRILASHPYPMFRIQSAVLHELAIMPSDLNVSQLALDLPNLEQLDANPPTGLRALDMRQPPSRLGRLSLRLRHCDMLLDQFKSPRFTSLLEIAITCNNSPTYASSALLPAFGRLLTLRGLPGTVDITGQSGGTASQLFVDSDFFLDILDVRRSANVSSPVPWYIHPYQTSLLQLIWRGLTCGTAEPSSGALDPYNFQMACAGGERGDTRSLPSKAAWRSFRCLDSQMKSRELTPFQMCDGTAQCDGGADEQGCRMQLSVVSSSVSNSDAYFVRCLRDIALTVASGVWTSVPASTQVKCYHGHGILTSAWTAEGYFGTTTVKYFSFSRLCH